MQDFVHQQYDAVWGCRGLGLIRDRSLGFRGLGFRGLFRLHSWSLINPILGLTRLWGQGLGFFGFWA